jgi:hypothetical protein
MARLAGSCPLLLERVSRRRDLAQLSYSHPYFDPLPELLWTRSLRQMLSYVRSRARPDADGLAQMREYLHQHPSSPDAGWYAQSQLKRLLRLTYSRPVRPQTMLPVRAVLEASR